MASNTPASVKEALDLIENAKLPHPSDALLSFFVSEALVPGQAAEYVLGICRTSSDREADLLSLVSDWTYIVESFTLRGSPAPAPDASTRIAITKRDGFKCCITGKPGNFWDPLVVVPVLPVPSELTDPEPRIFDMLGAFFTPPYRDWWLSYTRDPEHISPCHTHWLVRKSAAHAFSRGLLRLNRLQPSMTEYKVEQLCIGTLAGPISLHGSYPLLGDHSRSGTKKVDARYTGTQARLAPSIRWLDVAKYAALNKRMGATPLAILPNEQTTNRRPGRNHGFSLQECFSSICLVAWRMVPARARIATYRLLQKVGHGIYGRTHSSQVQRLPFGLYLKYLGDPISLHNEFNALQMVRQYTSIPVPRPLDIAFKPSKPNDTIFFAPSESEDPVVFKPLESTDPFHSRDAYLLTTRVPGVPLGSCLDMLSDQDVADFVAQMQEYLSQLRAIPKTVSPEYTICNTLGGPITDTRIRDGNPVGPFVDEASFSQLLRNPDEPSRRGHKSVFTHADLNLRNILVDQVTMPDGTRGWTVSGIVDWEFSGYYPEYWDYTKSLFEGFRYLPRGRNLLHAIFKAFGGYPKEFEVENRSWEEGDYI